MPDGQPQTQIMWVHADDEHVLINTEIGRQKFRNVQRDPRVTVTVFNAENPYQYVEARGRVVETVDGDPARADIDELSQKYMGTPYGDADRSRAVGSSSASRSTRSTRTATDSMPRRTIRLRHRRRRALLLAELAAITFPLATPASTAPAAIATFVAEVLNADRFRDHVADPARLVLDRRARRLGPVGLLDPHRRRTGRSRGDRRGAHHARRSISTSSTCTRTTTARASAATLMAATVEAARATGARSVWLGVNNENVRANRFYEKHGFAVVGDKHFRLGDRFEDDFVRELVLDRRGHDLTEVIEAATPSNTARSAVAAAGPGRCGG